MAEGVRRGGLVHARAADGVGHRLLDHALVKVVAVVQPGALVGVER